MLNYLFPAQSFRRVSARGRQGRLNLNVCVCWSGGAGHHGQLSSLPLGFPSGGDGHAFGRETQKHFHPQSQAEMDRSKKALDLNVQGAVAPSSETFLDADGLLISRKGLLLHAPNQPLSQNSAYCNIFSLTR